MDDIEARKRTLTRDVEAIHQDLHNIPFFQPGATVLSDELRVLRRWNSHTPMLHFSYGGGYLLRWKGSGTVIDPGVTFLDVIQHRHALELLGPHHMDDINLVVVTHDHADHCEDLGMLLVLLRNYNRWRKKQRPPLGDYTLDLVQSIGAHFRSVILLDNAETRNYVRAIDVPPPRRGTPGSKRPLDLKARYHMEVEEFWTDHTEVLGDRSALGFRMKLYDGDDLKFTYCDSGDTGYNDKLLENYRDCDLLLLHVGTMDDPKTEHLCFDGVRKILDDLQRSGRGPKLVLLGEWGEEFRGPGYRRRCAELVKEAAGYAGPVLPADLGMRIELTDRCRVMCRQPNANTTLGVPPPQDWTPPADVIVEDWGQWIEYHVR